MPKTHCAGSRNLCVRHCVLVQAASAAGWSMGGLSVSGSVECTKKTL
jgi:hypothetical protein